MSEPKFLTVDHLTTSQITRIFSKIIVNKETGCWEWQGKLNHNGYGKTWHKGRSETIHRLLYAWLVEPLPQGVAAHIPNLDHIVCNTRQCGNPAHVKLVPPRSNTLRSEATPSAMNSRKTLCPQGHPYTIAQWKQGQKRICQICHNERAKERRRTPEGHQVFLEYHRQWQERNRQKCRDAVKRSRDKRRLLPGSH